MTARTSPARTAAWLLVDPHDPEALFLGGTSPANVTGVNASSAWLMRSTDAGHTWVDLTRQIDAVASEATYFSPLYLAADGRHLYMNIEFDLSPASGWADIVSSADAGQHWHSLAQEQHLEQQHSSGPGFIALAQGSAQRLYAVAWTETSISFGTSGNVGRTWAWSAYPGDVTIEEPYELQLVVPDPRHRDTVYANTMDPQTDLPEATFLRSDDAGRHWITLHAPVKKGFAIVPSTHEGGLVVGQRQDLDRPPDQRYVSANQGRTWHVRHCPGDVEGDCPQFIVDNVFGAGASYGFVDDGIYRFHGAGAAEIRLAVSTRLPFSTADIVAVGAVSRQGAPIYVATPNRLYRTTTEGRTWVGCAISVLPHGLPKA